MRTFIAIDLERETTRAVLNARPALEGALGDSAKPAWTHAETMHLTLHFLGDVSEPAVQTLRAALSRPLVTRVFDLAFGGFGFFPARGAPRVLWMAPTRGKDELVSLHAELRERVEAAGIEVDARAYQPHLTLARFRRPPSAHARTAIAELANPTMPTSRIDHVTLYESQLSAGGATHIALARLALPAI